MASDLPAGLLVAGHPEIHEVVPTHRVAIEDNLFYGIGRFLDQSNGRMMLLLGPLEDVVIRRNTMLHTSDGTHALLLDADAPSRRLEVSANLFTRGQYGVWSSGTEGTQALERAWPGAWTFRDNVLLTETPASSQFPYPGSASSLRVAPEEARAAYTARTLDGVGAVLRRLPTDARVGVDLARLHAHLAGVAPELTAAAP